MPRTSFLKIGALSEATGTKVETIRYYEQIGLLPAPRRTTGNYRAYDQSHLQRLAFIRRGRDLGFSIEQIRKLLELADRKDHACIDVDEIANEHLAEVEWKIASLQALGQELRSLIAQCRRGTIADCRIIEALSPASTDKPDV